MPEQVRGRWAPPVSTAAAFTEEQAQRVQALRAAREIVEGKTGGPFSNASSVSNTVDLLIVAGWIVEGPQSLQSD